MAISFGRMGSPLESLSPERRALILLAVYSASEGRGSPSAFSFSQRMTSHFTSVSPPSFEQTSSSSFSKGVLEELKIFRLLSSFEDSPLVWRIHDIFLFLV